MGSHPLNLAIRFLLELTALVALGIWGWQQGHNGYAWLGYVLAMGLPIMAAAIWGIFNVPDDPSRSGKAPVIVAGTLRLLIELTFFSFACWALYDLGYTTFCMVLGGVVVVHYLVSYDRIFWLMKQ